MVTTTGLLENRLRFDAQQQRAGNGARTTVLDGGRGLDLIVGETEEIQIGAPPYEIRDIRSNSSSTSEARGFGDWPFLRLEQRLASSPENGEDYVVTAWLQIQAPTGEAPFTNRAWIISPTLAFGKGWGDFDIQGTITSALPASHSDTLGHPVQTNLAFQYHVDSVFWPEVETTWTYYPDGTRGGLSQLFLTLGLVIGRFALADDVLFTFGGGYQIALAPAYRAKPLTPAYDRAWLLTLRLNFK